MKATLTFPTKQMAENFATAWSRHSLNGHTIGSGDTNVKVSIYNVNEDNKEWIDKYIANLNKNA